MGDNNDRKSASRQSINTGGSNNDTAELSSLDGKTNEEIHKLLDPYLDLNKLKKTSALHLCSDVAQIYGTLVLTGGALYSLYNLWGLIVPLAALPITTLLNARALRGAEHWVHNGSHDSVGRAADGSHKKRKANDLLTDVLFSTLILQTVGGYRRSHLPLHHGAFGTSRDPCKRMRAGLTELAKAGATSRLELAKTLLRVLPTYCADYYREVGSRKQALRQSAAMHAALIGIMTIFLGAETALALWIAVFALPFATVLQGLRALGEASEHDYGDPQLSEAAATYNNLGWFQRTFVNPFGDAYHFIHHLWGQVPPYYYPSIHRTLRDNPTYRLVRTRKRLLEQA